MSGLVGSIAAGAVFLAAAGCVHDDASPGPPAGPSELGLSLTLTASPDTLALDGFSQSVIGIRARDAFGAPAPDLRLSVRIATSRGFEDFGRLSSRWAVTGPDGRAAVTYTVPSEPADRNGAVDDDTTVTIWVTPVGPDYAGAVSRRVTIRLAPPGVVIPPFDVTAGFHWVPTAPAVGDQVRFATVCRAAADTGCVRDPRGVATGYRWSFGDGVVAAGREAIHAYEAAGAYVVSLTVSDDAGRTARASRSLTVAVDAAPKAVLAVSPTRVAPNVPVHFNGRGSTAASGRAVTSYEWDFGDGSTATGATASHSYVTEGAFAVMLRVTDDRGRVGTAAAVVTVVRSSDDDAPRQP